jgi:hypothetical protein
MATPAPRKTLPRAVLALALAYGLALQALLGAMSSGVFAGEVRRAAELGVICTIHGAVDGADREGGPADPTPGRIACLEHCLLTAAQAGPPPNAPQSQRLAIPQQIAPLALRDRGRAHTHAAAPPLPARGPPLLA